MPLETLAESALLDALLTQATVGVAVLDEGLRCVRINAALARLGGVPMDRCPGRPFGELGATGGEALAEIAAEAVRSGAPVPTTPVHPRSPDGDAFWEVTAYPIRGEEAVAGVWLVVQDVTDRQRALAAERAARERAQQAEARARHLARASAALSSSLDLRATLQTVAELAVPEVADWAFVELVQPDGMIKRVAWAVPHPALEHLARDYDRRWPLDPDAPVGSAAVVRTGRAELMEEIPEAWYDALVTDPEQERILREVGFRSSVVVPLVARGRVIGDLALAYSASERRYGEADLEMLEALADACALAIDNARLFSEQQAAARTLQASLLPPRLPAIAGLEVAAYYRPFGSGAEVGGDFYDVFPVPAGWGVVVGDVAGKGTEAAVATSFLRHTVRIAAHLEPSPGDVLEHLNRAVLREGDDERLATVTCAFVRRGTREALVRIAAAGHPPPLLRRADGRVSLVPARGTLIGACERVEAEEATVRLRTGDALVFYTDGVTEARIPGGFLGERGLLDILAGVRPGATAGELAGTIEREAVRVQGGHPRDDIAVLVLAMPPDAA